MTAQPALEKAIRSESDRRLYVDFFTEAIEHANACGTNRWGIKYGSFGLRLLVGRFIACNLVRDRVWFALDKEVLDSRNDLKTILDRSSAWVWDDEYPMYQKVPSVNGYLTLTDCPLEVRAAAQTLFFEFVSHVCRTHRRLDISSQQGHSTELLRYLSEIVGRDLPEPSYVSDPDEVSILDDLSEADHGLLTLNRDTTRQAIIESRLGQGVFRQQLLQFWNGKCSVTGCSFPAVLRASHVKPWRVASNEERLDVHNGLLLTADLDALFDSGYISFDDDDVIMISSELSSHNRDLLGVRTDLKLAIADTKRDRYMKHHRKHVFRA